MMRQTILRRETVLTTVSLCFFLLGSLSTTAQDCRLNRYEPSILLQQPTDSSQTLSFNLDVTTFFRDAEFSMPYTPGYTVSGFFLNPTASYSIASVGRLTLGLHLAGAAGYQGVRLWQPLVRMECTPTPNLRLVMGTLYGNLSHGLYEPMLDRERYIYDNHEEGVQLLAYIRPLRWQTDTWLHWENLLEPWQMDQERFTLGSNNEITPLKLCQTDTGQVSSFKFQVSIPFSFLGSHRGGQFSALDTCIESLFTESVGLRVTLNSKLSTFNSQLSLHLPFFFYQDISPKSYQAYKDGRGFWPQITLSLMPGSTPNSQFSTEGRRPPVEPILNSQLSIGYWLGHQYIAPRGGYLFQSVSWDDPDYRQPDRQMLTARLALQKDFTPNFSLGADCEAYYDLEQRHTDIAFGLYMRFTY